MAPSHVAAPPRVEPAPPPAALAGSLGVFDLHQILSLLAVTGRRGELQVVGGGLDGRLWVDEGAFVGFTLGASRSVGEAVFELSLLDEGWFYFTEGRKPRLPIDPEHVAGVLDAVRPQVEEWRHLLGVLPLDATVRLVPSPPGGEVNIRAEQWQVLAAVGNDGRLVGAVVDAMAHEQVVTLRTLSGLVDSGLVEVVPTHPADLEPPLLQGETPGDGQPPPFRPGVSYTPPGGPRDVTMAPRPAHLAGELVPPDDITVLPPDTESRASNGAVPAAQR